MRDKLSIIGDSILASSFLTYMGAFEGSYREKIVRDHWKIILSKEGISVSEEFSLKNVIGIP